MVMAAVCVHVSCHATFFSLSSRKLGCYADCKSAYYTVTK